MSVKFTHYLITRFNVPVKNWDRDKAGKPVLDDAWMRSRLELFRRYCVPGLANQTVKNFTWLIYCDTLTAPHFLNAIYQVKVDVPESEIRLVNNFDHLMTDLKQLISSAPTPFVITSRLDNDDGLGPFFIAEVQEQFEEIDRMIINFTKGVLYDAQRGILTEIRNSHGNHYASLIEVNKPNHEPVTVVGYHHAIPPEGSSIKIVETRFAWLKIIHQRNMVSRTNGIPLMNREVVKHFNLQPGDLEQSWWATSIFVIHRFLARLKRKILRY